jgi:hypothetical protein
MQPFARPLAPTARRPQVAASDMIDLNVGGRLLTTTRRTLGTVQDSLLATMFRHVGAGGGGAGWEKQGGGGSCPARLCSPGTSPCLPPSLVAPRPPRRSGRWADSVARDASGRAFLDLDPELFELVLAWLRYFSIAAPGHGVVPEPAVPKGKADAMLVGAPGGGVLAGAAGGTGEPAPPGMTGSGNGGALCQQPVRVLSGPRPPQPAPPPPRIPHAGPQALLDYLCLHRHVPLTYNEAFSDALHGPGMIVYGDTVTRAALRGAAAAGRPALALSVAAGLHTYFDVRVSPPGG